MKYWFNLMLVPLLQCYYVKVRSLSILSFTHHFLVPTTSKGRSFLARAGMRRSKKDPAALCSPALLSPKSTWKYLNLIIRYLLGINDSKFLFRGGFRGGEDDHGSKGAGSRNLRRGGASQRGFDPMSSNFGGGNMLGILVVLHFSYVL